MDNILYRGIDLSAYNDEVDFETVKKAGYDFVIIRIGYGKLSSQKDNKFEEYYSKAKEAGLYIGGYWYSYAQSVDDSILEAKACLECIKDKTFDFPIYYQVMEKRQFANLDNITMTKMANTFCKTIKAEGYMTGLNTDYNSIKYNFNEYQFKYEKWITRLYYSLDINDDYGYTMWKYAVMGKGNDATIRGVVPGCKDSFGVGLTYAFKDYPHSKYEESITKPLTIMDTIKNGTKLYLDNISIYSAAGGTKPLANKSGTYYVYNKEPINGKLRITDNINNVGRTPITHYLTGWINISDLEEGKVVVMDKENTLNIPSSLYTGREINLSNIRVYNSAFDKNAVSTKTGKYYIYSDIIENNRIRITSQLNYVGRTPMADYVLGWIDVNSIN